MDDTIVAIGTALGIGAISIIKISGENAIQNTNQIFRGKNLEQQESHTITYGHIVDQDTVIDEVLVSIMKAPRTFTREDVVEINCHGGIAATNRVLELLLRNGCRLAEPGEFSKRAFLNGRIDLIEAEAISDLINATTEKSRQLSMNQLDKKVSNLIHNLRDDLLNILANIEVNIDYPEYTDEVVVTNHLIEKEMAKITKELNKIVKESENGKIVKTGITTAIIGKPNVGKSSLLNRLIDEEKAIVTDIQGTTRDIVEGELTIDGIKLNLIDTAGIRRTDDIIEKIGVSKSLDMIKEADLILLLFNNNEKLSEEDLQLLKETEQKKRITLLNKIDLQSNIDRQKLPANLVEISALNNIGIDHLKQTIRDMFHFEEIETSDLTYLTNARQIALLKEAASIADEINIGLENEVEVDMLEIDLKRIWELLGEIIGITYDEELIDALFSQFCLGK